MPKDQHLNHYSSNTFGAPIMCLILGIQSNRDKTLTMTDGKVRREKNIIKQVVLGEVASALNINRKLDRWMGG